MSLEPNTSLSMHYCFDASKEPLNALAKYGKLDGIAAKWLMATQPSESIKSHAERIARWLSEHGAIPVQMRIERDWLHYLKKRKQPRHQADPKYILSKIRATHEFSDVGVPSRMITFPLGDLPCSWQDRC